VAEIAQLISSISGKNAATDATASAAMQLNSILKKKEAPTDLGSRRSSRQDHGLLDAWS